MPVLTLGLPCKFQVHARFAETLLSVIETLRVTQSYWDVKPRFLIGKSNIAHSRSVIVTDWYDKAAPDDGFFFIDSDHTFTADDILRVIGLKGDINAGIYANKARLPTSFPLAGGFDEKAENIPLKYAGTGFMFFRRSALDAIYAWMRTTEGIDRVTISDIPGSPEYAVIPFFNEVIEPPRADGKRFWLGEDFSFCWRAGQAGLRIMGCVTYTLGHEIPFLIYNDGARRGPVQWAPGTVVVYCGAKRLDPRAHLDYLSLMAKNYRVVIFSTDTPTEDGPILFKRYEEFQVADTFDTLVLDQDGLTLLEKVGGAQNFIVEFSRPTDSLPLAIQRSTRVRFWDVNTEERYRTLIPDHIRYVGRLSDLL